MWLCGLDSHHSRTASRRMKVEKDEGRLKAVSVGLMAALNASCFGNMIIVLTVPLQPGIQACVRHY